MDELISNARLPEDVDRQVEVLICMLEQLEGGSILIITGIAKPQELEKPLQDDFKPEVLPLVIRNESDYVVHDLALHLALKQGKKQKPYSHRPIKVIRPKHGGNIRASHNFHRRRC